MAVYLIEKTNYDYDEEFINENVSPAFDPQKDKKKLNKHNKKSSIHSMRSGLAPWKTSADGTYFKSDGSMPKQHAGNNSHCGSTNAGCANPGSSNCIAGGGPSGGGGV